MKKTFSLKKAFSLIELSIVILIIGILIAGVTQSSRLIRAFRVSTAQSLTQSSPVASIKGLIFWFETSLEASFLSSEASDQTVITQWNDINPQNSYKANAWAGQRTTASAISYNIASSGTTLNTSGPTYIENGINSVPTLRFTNAATTYRYLSVDYSAKNFQNEGMTVFAVVSHRSGSGWIFDRNCVTSAGVPNACGSSYNLGNPLFGAQISSNSLLFDARDNAGTLTSSGNFYFTTGGTLSPNNKYVLTFERRYGTDFRAFINGIVTSTTVADGLGMINMDPVKIGRHADNNADTLDIDISEFILFSGKVKDVDREAVEDYLGKKYGIKVN
jgi:prepilin-type N-terminal cleavage/methylation domain-containing protein